MIYLEVNFTYNLNQDFQSSAMVLKINNIVQCNLATDMQKGETLLPADFQVKISP
jgi:hypothetical protein